MKRFPVAILAAATLVGTILVGGAPAATAATASATITGKVIAYDPSLHNDKDGIAGIAGISVNARGKNGTVYSTRTRAGGTFTLRVAPGTYGIKFSDRVGHIYCDGGCSGKIYNKTEWLGDATSYAASEKVVAKAGKKTTGIRVLMAETASISGAITVDGAVPTSLDVQVIIRSVDGKRRHSSFTQKSKFAFSLRADNYTIKVKSRSDAFAPFFLTDPTDGNTVFHVNGVGKQTGVRMNVVTQ
jgi:hypothetical protein